MAHSYDRDFYSRQFARLLNQSLKRGGGDPRLALVWLQRNYHLVFNLLVHGRRLELADAYMDVREHIVKRIDESGLDVGNQGN